MQGGEGIQNNSTLMKTDEGSIQMVRVLKPEKTVNAS